ncbi:zinc-dependent metalloprotease, partial [Erythrobacter sp. SN021]|nr:zinc-dependent metalloprotease [Erythrobacter sp. SN021]
TDSVNPFSTSTDASANPIGFTSAGNSDTPAADGTAQVSGSDASADAADAAAFEAALSGFETTEKIPESEVLSFLALQEMAHARLYASVPWLMPRFEALIGKYARGISIDLDAMEEQLRDATSMDP